MKNRVENLVEEHLICIVLYFVQTGTSQKIIYLATMLKVKVPPGCLLAEPVIQVVGISKHPGAKN